MERSISDSPWENEIAPLAPELLGSGNGSSGSPAQLLFAFLNGGSLILLVVAVTGVLNLHRWSARLRVSACEKSWEE